MWSLLEELWFSSMMKMRLRESPTLHSAVNLLYIYIYTSGVAGQNFNDVNTEVFLFFKPWN